MAELVVTVDETGLSRLVGTETFRQGRELADAGRVTGARWHADGRRAFGQVRGNNGIRTAMVFTDHDGSGTMTGVRSHCTCAAKQPCEHATAVLLSAVTESAVTKSAMTESATAGSAAAGSTTARSTPADDVAEPDGVPAWERSLAALLPPTEPVDTGDPQARLALQFDASTAADRTRGSLQTRIELRPVLPGARGNWIRTGISWQTLGYARIGASSAARAQLALLREIQALYSSAPGHHPYAQLTPLLENAPSRRIWDLLAEARELGLPLVQYGKGDPPVTLETAPAHGTLSVSRTPAGLELAARVMAGGEPVELDSALLLGQPAHGVAWWQPSGRELRLAPLQGTIDARFARLLGSGPVRIPVEDEDRFLRDWFPRLRERVHVSAQDSSVELPAAQPPVLVVTAQRRSGHRLSLSWAWRYAVGQARRSESLWPGPARERGRDRSRDLETETQILGPVTTVAEAVPELHEDTPGGRRLAPAAELDGIATVRVLTDVLPALAALDGVEVALGTDEEDLPDYREADEAPLITLSGDTAQDDRDWFNLAVTVSVDAQEVPFDELFVALAQEQEHLILRSGTYFSLDRPEFRRLRGLIEEARALQDVETGGVRLSRFQAGLWEELERIGVVGGQAAQWQESVRRLSTATEVTEHATPAGLKATLRPYQLAGFNWLAALYSYRLGGVLADDMGLGKTLQALALFSHVREHGLSDAPFLVVAPTSVVLNWAAEAERFTPGLKVAQISETRARRGGELAVAVAGVDIVVTSYTLFRLEYDEYAGIEWAGLVLDEAQFVKNHQSQGYRCAKQLPAPFKLAITGTPMENTLMELWSLLSITAPGLFANPARFTEYYRTPIEKGQDAELLDQLRRRVRPLMLRRTKEQVATDLPDKQEQVIELELNPRHRKVYQTHLARERQKVLGLLDDMSKNRFEIFRSLTLLRQASLDVALIDPQYAGVPSTKLDAMMELVTDIAEEGHRTLIFSQFTRFLGSARDRLTAAGIEHCYLDGSTRDRAAVLREFKTGTAPVFLISLKAGGFGLNLTEADYCILLDPWWNPATEAQAVDRVHRIGQTRKVMVYRLVAKDTIEEKVMALKAGKSALFSSVMSGEGLDSGSLSATDIRGLLD